MPHCTSPLPRCFGATTRPRASTFAGIGKDRADGTIGDQFVRSYPDATLVRLRKWMQDPDENVRWNVAMALSAASGARIGQKAPDVLEFLASDERPFVRGAVRAAQRRIRTLVA